MRDRMFAGMRVAGILSVAGAIVWGVPVGVGAKARGQAAGQAPAPTPAQAPFAAPAGSSSQNQAGAATAAVKSRLGGVWKLNSQLSDPPRRAPSPDDIGGGGMRGHPGGGFGGPGGGGGMGGHMGGGGGTGGPGMGAAVDRERIKQMRALIEELMGLPASLTISETDQTVTFTEPDGRSRTYRTDGKKEKHSATNGTVETRTHWQDAGLVVETDLGHGIKAVRTYSVSGDPRQLTVLLKIDGGPVPRERKPHRAIYDDTTAAAQ